MSSTFSNLKFELIATGEQSGAWGATTNSNIGTAIEQAIVGMATLTSGSFTANVATLTLTNTTSAQNARALCLVVDAGALSAAGTINVPAIQKPYLIINNSSYAVTVKVSGLTGVSVPAGKRTVVYNNGTDVGNQVDYLSSLVLGSALPVASGGTGTTTSTGTGSVVLSTSPALVTPVLGTPASGNLANCTFPTLNQNTTGTAAGLSSTLAVSSGGTGQTTYTDGQLLIGNSTGNTLTKATLTAGSNITITNSAGGITIASSNPGGTVTSVSGTSPVASSGGTTPVISLSDGYGDTKNPYASKSANYFLASPNGSSAAPSFRAIVAADIPTLNQNTTGTAAGLSAILAVGSGGTGQTTYTDGQLLIGNSTGNTLTKATLTAGSGVTITNGNGSISIAATGSGGTVTSVTGTSPVSSSGGTTPAISLDAGYGDTKNPYASKTAKYVLAAPNGADGVPAFRALVASDIPTLNQNTTGTAAGLSATLAVESGGTGVTTSTGSGNVVLSTSPTLVTPALGTPASGNLANCTFPTLNQNTTGTAAGLSATLAVTSGGTGVTTSTGTGSVVLSTSPTLVTPALGTPASGNLTNCTFPTLNQNTTGSAGSVVTTGFSIVESGGKLVFKYGATTIASLDSSGNFTSLANTTAYGTP